MSNINNNLQEVLNFISAWDNCADWRFNSLDENTPDYKVLLAEKDCVEAEYGKIGDVFKTLSQIEKIKICDTIIDKLAWGNESLLYFRPLSKFIRNEEKIRGWKINKDLMKQFIVGILYYGCDDRSTNWFRRQYLRPNVQYSLTARKSKLRVRQIVKLIKRGDAKIYRK